MKRIIVKNQKEFDAISDGFKVETKVIIDNDMGNKISMFNKIPMAFVVVVNNGFINVMRGNSQVNELRDNSQVNEMWGNSQVNAMRDNSQVNAMTDNSQVNEMWGNSQVNAMWDNSRVNEMWENSQVKCYSDGCKIKAKHNTIVILFECVPRLNTTESVHVVHTERFKHTKESFIDMYGSNSEIITLYKSVDPETNCDFYTQRINYIIGKEIECFDWDDNCLRQCGGGFHLSPKPEQALEYNQGKLLVCHVHIDDFVVFPDDITKVRCKKVKVIEEYKTE